MEKGAESTSSEGAQQQQVPASLEHVMLTSSHDETLRDHYSFIHNVSQYYNSKELSDVAIKVGEYRPASILSVS